MIKSRFDNLLHLIITLFSLIMIIVIVLFSHKTTKLELKAGDISDTNVYASRTIDDKITTDADRAAARNSVPDMYIFDAKGATDTVSNIFQYVSTLKSKEDLLLIKSLNEFKNYKTDIAISDKTKEVIIGASDEQFAQMNMAPDIISSLNSENSLDPTSAKKACDERINNLTINDSQKAAVKEIIHATIDRNMTFDAEKTETLRKAAEDAVPKKEYKKGQKIVSKGDPVTEAQLAVIKDLGMLKGTSSISFSYTTGVLLFIIVCYIVLFYCTWNSRKGDKVSLPVISVVGFALVILCYYASRLVPDNMVAILPLGIFPEIVALFSNPQISIISNVIFSIFFGIEFDANWSLTVCLILAGTMSSYAFSTVKRRSHLLPAAIVSAVFYSLAFGAMSFVEEIPDFADAFITLGKGFLGGILSGLITIGSIQFFEWLFNATTPMKLSELTNPENKLLKKLLVEAPGSYHHSLTVANISEIAARSIHANSLLARVGAYYHDIGKIRHPLFFKENQFDKNAHDDLTPEESSALIISHVTDGVDIAQKNRLPKVVIDIISQHHGTTTTGYFLIRAREIDPDVDPAKFTYPGPAPRTKEAAIVMLADSCEAAVRSIDEKSEVKIEAMVRKIATERVNSGQFSQCNLTFAELETVIKVITKTLGGYFHERIKYE